MHFPSVLVDLLELERAVAVDPQEVGTAVVDVRVLSLGSQLGLEILVLLRQDADLLACLVSFSNNLLREDRPVSLSMMTLAERTSPYGEKISVNRCLSMR